MFWKRTNTTGTIKETKASEFEYLPVPAWSATVHHVATVVAFNRVAEAEQQQADVKHSVKLAEEHGKKSTDLLEVFAA